MQSSQKLLGYLCKHQKMKYEKNIFFIEQYMKWTNFMIKLWNNIIREALSVMVSVKNVTQICQPLVGSFIVGEFSFWARYWSSKCRSNVMPTAGACLTSAVIYHAALQIFLVVPDKKNNRLCHSQVAHKICRKRDDCVLLMYLIAFISSRLLRTA